MFLITNESLFNQFTLRGGHQKPFQCCLKALCCLDHVIGGYYHNKILGTWLGLKIDLGYIVFIFSVDTLAGCQSLCIQHCIIFCLLRPHPGRHMFLVTGSIKLTRQSGGITTKWNYPKSPAFKIDFPHGLRIEYHINLKKNWWNEYLYLKTDRQTDILEGMQSK